MGAQHHDLIFKEQSAKGYPWKNILRCIC